MYLKADFGFEKASFSTDILSRWDSFIVPKIVGITIRKLKIALIYKLL